MGGPQSRPPPTSGPPGAPLGPRETGASLGAEPRTCRLHRPPVRQSPLSFPPATPCATNKPSVAPNPSDPRAPSPPPRPWPTRRHAPPAPPRPDSSSAPPPRPRRRRRRGPAPTPATSPPRPLPRRPGLVGSNGSAERGLPRRSSSGLGTLAWGLRAGRRAKHSRGHFARRASHEDDTQPEKRTSSENL